MNLSHRVIVEELSAFGAESLLSEDTSFSFSGFQMISAGTHHFNPSMLYVGTASQLQLVDPAILRELCIACIVCADSVTPFFKETGANLIILPETCEIALIINVLFNLFDRAKQWSSSVRNAVAGNQGYQALMDLGRMYFGDNPIVLVNSSYNLVASSHTNVTGFPRVDDLLRDGYYNKEIIDTFVRMGYMKSAPSFSPFISHPPNYMGCPFLIRTFHSKADDKLLGFLNVYYTDKSEVSALEYEIFLYFALQVYKYCFRKEDEASNVPSQLEVFLHDLIHHTKEDNEYLLDRARFLQLPSDGTYRMCVISHKASNRREINYLMLRLQSNSVFPYFKLFPYKDMLILLLRNTNSSLKTMIETDDGYAEFLYLLKLVHAHAGFSTNFDSFLKMDVAFKQATASIRLGARLNPECNVYFYSNIYIYDMIDSYSNSFPLEDMYFLKLRLLTGSGDTNYDNITLLKIFLLSERNITLTAKMVHMHRNSVIYRLSKIQDVLGVTLDDPDVRLRILISLKILELIHGKAELSPHQEERVSTKE